MATAVEGIDAVGTLVGVLYGVLVAGSVAVTNWGVRSTGVGVPIVTQDVAARAAAQMIKERVRMGRF